MTDPRVEALATALRTIHAGPAPWPRGITSIEFAAAILAALPPGWCGHRRDPRVDWDAVERLVDAAIRREEISADRGAEILGLRLQTWRERAKDLRTEREGAESTDSPSLEETT